MLAIAYAQLRRNFGKRLYVLFAAVQFVQQLRAYKFEIQRRQIVPPAGGVEHAHVGVYRVPDHQIFAAAQIGLYQLIPVGKIGRSVQQFFVQMQVYAHVFARAVKIICRFGVYPYVGAIGNAEIFLRRHYAYAAYAVRLEPVCGFYVECKIFHITRIYFNKFPLFLQ